MTNDPLARSDVYYLNILNNGNAIPNLTGTDYTMSPMPNSSGQSWQAYMTTTGPTTAGFTGAELSFLHQLLEDTELSGEGKRNPFALKLATKIKKMMEET